MHILRERRGKIYGLTGHRMGKTQKCGMKRLAVDKTIIRVIEKISRKRVTDSFHMDADLVRSSGL